MTTTPLDRESKVAEQIATFAKTNADLIGRSVAEALAEGAPKGTKIPAVASLLALLAEATSRAAEDAHAAEAAVRAEESDDPPLLAKRDALTPQLKARLVTLRDALRIGCGPAAVRAVGFVGETPDDPAVLARLARTVAKNIADDPPKATTEGVTLDVKKLTHGLAALAGDLEQTLEDIRREARELQVVRVDRDKRVRVARRRRIGLAGVLEALCTFVGEDELAARVRPASRQGSGDAEEDLEPSPPVDPTPK